jgi:hypothetical protein
MTFRNPWIDPRVGEVRPAAARAYLLGHGWKPLPAGQANLELFAAPSGEDGPVVQVPLLEGGRDYPQRVIELITDLALAEGRYAVAVLNDILGQAVEPVTTNGAAASTQAEPTVR